MKKFVKNNYILFLGTILLLILVHLPLLTKNIITADVLLNNFFYNSYSWEISLGRFGLYIVGILKGFNSIPIIDLSVSFIIIPIITYFLLDLFEIKKLLNKVFVVLIMVISPIMSATLLFHYCAIGYLIAFLCSVLSTYVFYKIRNKYLKNILPIILIVISLSMYQAYLSVIVTVFVLYNIKLLLNNKYDYKKLIHYLILLFIGVVTYFILMKLSLIVFHINMSDYSNADKIGINTMLSIPNKFIDSYKLFFDFFFKDNIMKNSYLHNYIFSTILFILMIIFIVKNIIKNKVKTKHIILISILVLLLPVFLNSVIFVVNESKLQLLMSMSYILIPIFILSFEDKIYNYITFIVLGLLIRNYYVQDQATYRSLENTYNSYDKVIKKAIDTDKEYKYMFIGNIDNSKNDIYKSNYGFISDDGIFWSEYYLKNLAFPRYVHYYHNKDIEFVDEDTYNELVKYEYPELINYNDNIIVINFDKV